MHIRSFYKLYHKKPIEEKIDLLIDNMVYLADNRVAYNDATWRRNEEEKRYDISEVKAMGERCRYLRWAILEEIKEREKIREKLENDLEKFNEENRHEKILGQKWNLKKGG